MSLEEPRSRISAPRDPAPASRWDSHRTRPEHVGTSYPLPESTPWQPRGWASRPSSLVPSRVIFGAVIGCPWTVSGPGFAAHPAPLGFLLPTLFPKLVGYGLCTPVRQVRRGQAGTGGPLVLGSQDPKFWGGFVYEGLSRIALVSHIPSPGPLGTAPSGPGRFKCAGATGPICSTQGPSISF